MELKVWGFGIMEIWLYEDLSDLRMVLEFDGFFEWRSGDYLGFGRENGKKLFIMIFWSWGFEGGFRIWGSGKRRFGIFL